MILLLRIGLFTPLLQVLGLFALCVESSPLVTELAQLRSVNIDCVKQRLLQHKPAICAQAVGCGCGSTVWLNGVAGHRLLSPGDHPDLPVAKGFYQDPERKRLRVEERQACRFIINIWCWNPTGRAVASFALANTLQQRLAWGQGDARFMDNIVGLEKVLRQAVMSDSSNKSKRLRRGSISSRFIASNRNRESSWVSIGSSASRLAKYYL